MQRKPVITADALSPDWLGAAARPLPDLAQSPQSPQSPATGSDADASASAAPRAGVWRSALRWLRDAVIGLAIITSIPLVAIGTRDADVYVPPADLGVMLAYVEPMRVLRLPTTAELSPAAAGQLWHATNVVGKSGMFPMHPAAPPAERSWEQVTLSDDMFVGIRRYERRLLESSKVLRVAAAGLSDTERQYLRVIAEAPIWRDVDRLAAAEAIDVTGARYVLPFRADASPVLLPIPRFAATKELAYAALSRAAYHVSQGEPDRAEHALRSMLSYGFAMIDNGTSTIDGLIGRVVVGIAGDGLHTLYTMTGDQARAALTAPRTIARSAPPERQDGPREAHLIALASDPMAARSLRMESLLQLAFNSCTTVRGVLAGPSDATNAAFDEARRTLARYPSERALIDLLEDAPNRPLDDSELESKSDWLLMGAASVASTVLRNPRIETCSRVMNALR